MLRPARRATLRGLTALAGGIALLALPSALTGVAPAAEAPTPIPPEYVEELTVPFAVSTMAIGPEGSVWGTLPFAGQIERITLHGLLTGKYTLVTGSKPDQPFESSFPRQITLGSDGGMWFVDSRDAEGNSLIGRITPAGEVTHFIVPGGEGFVGGLALGPGGDMWFTDTTFATETRGAEGYIGRVSTTGAFTLYLIPTGSGSNLPEPHASDPAVITQGSDGNMWFTDNGHNEQEHGLVGRITPTGKVTEYQFPGGYLYSPIFISGIARAPDGNVWFDVYPEGIARVTPAGEITEYRIPGESSQPAGLTAGPDGNLWFAAAGVGTIGRITPSGAVTIFSQAAAGGPHIEAIVQGPEGDLWYPGEAGRVARLKPPYPPAATSAPTISGIPAPGNALTASTGAWEHEPAAFSYQWELCDAAGKHCEALPGETGRSAGVTDVEVGKTLRAAVTASNFWGATLALSPLSPAIQAPVAPPPLPPEPGPPNNTPVPEVGAAMAWKFAWSQRYTTVDSLILTGVPAGGEVEVQCRGRGCPFARRLATAAAVTPHGSITALSAAPRGLSAAAARHKRRCRGRHCGSPTRLTHAGELDLTNLWHGRRLRVGAQIAVTILKPGWIGKTFRFTVRSTGSPKVEITCLAAGSRTLATAC